MGTKKVDIQLDDGDMKEAIWGLTKDVMLLKKMINTLDKELAEANKQLNDIAVNKKGD